MNEVFETLFQVMENKKLLSASLPVRIAINGIEGVGKTTFATNFVAFLQEKKLPAFHISIDGFHHPKKIRYQQGRDSAKGYYEDSYDEEAFVSKVLLSSQKSGSYVPATHDLETDEYVFPDRVVLPQNALMITDGAYLLKDIYFSHWDLTIYLKADFDIARKRGSERDAQHLGGLKEAESKFLARYHVASQMYIDINDPEKRADIVIDNSDYDAPIVLRK